MKPSEWTENIIKNIADEISDHITIRTYVRGSSKDTKRETSEPEKNIMFNIVYAALHTMKNHDISNPEILSSILDIAEVTFDKFFPGANGYMSIYIPISNELDSYSCMPKSKTEND